MHTQALQKTQSSNTRSKSESNQSQLAIGHKDDSFEQEADAIADRVVMSPNISNEVLPIHRESTFSPFNDTTMPQTALQMKCESCEEEEEVADQTSTYTRMMAGGGATDENSNHQQKEKGGMATSMVQRKCKPCEEQEKVQLKPYCSSNHIGQVQSPTVQPKCDACKRKEGVQLKPQNHFSVGKTSDHSKIDDHLSSQIRSAAIGGIPLKPDVELVMSQKIGADFSDVRIHFDQQAIFLSKQLNARAFTYGNHIFFGQGEYNPNTTKGKHLLAHELVHTVQQGKSNGRSIQRQTDSRLTGQEIATAHQSIKQFFGPGLKYQELDLGQKVWEDSLTETHKALWKNTLIIVFNAKTQGFITSSQKKELENTLFSLGKSISQTFKKTEFPKEQKFKDLRSKVEALKTSVIPWSTSETACDYIKDQDNQITTQCEEIKKNVLAYPDIILTEMKKKSTFNYLVTAEPFKMKVEQNIDQLTILASGKPHSIKEHEFLTTLQVSAVEITYPAAYAIYEIFINTLKTGFDFDLESFNVMEDEVTSSDEAEASATATSTLSDLEEDILKANELIASSSGDGNGITEDVVLNLTKKAQKNAEAEDKLRGLNKTLADVLSKNAGNLTEDQKRALDPIDINKIPLFNEMMMLEGLMAGAGQVSPEINAQTIELKGNIHKLRSFIIDEIIWLAAEIGATTVLGALLAPVSMGASAVVAGGRAAMLIYRLNKFKELLEKAHRVYAIYQNVTDAIDTVDKGFGTFKKFMEFKDDFEQKKEKIEILYELLEDDPDKADEIALMEAELINEVVDKLEVGALSDLLNYLRLPEGLEGEELADEMERIILNIPAGIQAFHNLKTHYEAGKHKKADLDFATELAVKGVIAGAALYPLVGYIVEKVNDALVDLMNQESLLERFGGLFTSFGTGRKKKRKRPKTSSKEKISAAKRGDEKKDKDRIKRKHKRKQERSAYKKYKYDDQSSLKTYLDIYDDKFEKYLEDKKHSIINGFWTPLYYVFVVNEKHKDYLKQAKSRRVKAKRLKDNEHVLNAPAPPFKVNKLKPNYNQNDSLNFEIEVNPKVQVKPKNLKVLKPDDILSNYLPFNLGNKNEKNIKKIQSIKKWLDAYNYTLVPDQAGSVQIRLKGKLTGIYLFINDSHQIVGSKDLDPKAYRSFLGKQINSSDDLPEGYYLETPDVKHKETGKNWAELGLDSDDKLILTGADENDQVWNEILAEAKKSCNSWKAVSGGMTKAELQTKVDHQGLEKAYKGLKVEIKKGGPRRLCNWIVNYEWEGKKYVCEIAIKKEVTQKLWDDLQLELMQLCEDIRNEFENSPEKKGIAKTNLEKKVRGIKNKEPYEGWVNGGIVINSIPAKPVYYEMWIKHLCFDETSNKEELLINAMERYKYLKEEIKKQFNGWRLTDSSADRKKIRKNVEEGIEVLLLETELPKSTIKIEDSTSPDGWQIKGKSPRASTHKDAIFLVPGTYWGSQGNPVEFFNWPKPAIDNYPLVYIGPEVNNSDKKDVFIDQKDLENFTSKSLAQKATLTNHWKSKAINKTFKDKIDAWLSNPTIIIFKPTERKTLPGSSGKTIGVKDKYQVRVNKKLKLSDQGETTPGGIKINKELKRFGYDPTYANQDGDHVWEYQLGGPDSLENLWPLNESDNSSGGPKISKKKDFFDPSDSSVKNISVKNLKKIMKDENKEIWFVIRSVK